LKYLTENPVNIEQHSLGFKQFWTFYSMLNLSKIGKKCGIYKRSGHAPVRVLLEIVSLVFRGLTLFQATKSDSSPLQKDMVHRFLKRAEIDWYQWFSQIAWKVAQDFMPAMGSHQANDVLIIDDTMIERPRSKKVELLAWIWDHAKKRNVSAYQSVVLAVSDGMSVVPLDFRLKVGNHLVDASTKQVVPASTPAAARREQAHRTKLELAIDMVGRAIQNGFAGSYLLVDSWYALPAFITTIVRDHRLHTIGQVRSNFRVVYHGTSLTISQLHNLLRKRPGPGAVLAQVTADLKSDPDEPNVPVQIVFLHHRQRSQKWIALVTTDLDLEAEEIMQLYGRRWGIEVLFKMNKSYLRMTKELQSRSFDSMVAQVTISFLRYLYLGWNERQQLDSSTLGDLFLRETEATSGIRYQRALLDILEELFAWLKTIPEAFQEAASGMLEFIRTRVNEAMERRVMLKCES